MRSSQKHGFRPRAVLSKSWLWAVVLRRSRRGDSRFKSLLTQRPPAIRLSSLTFLCGLFATAGALAQTEAPSCQDFYRMKNGLNEKAWGMVSSTLLAELTESQLRELQRAVQRCLVSRGSDKPQSFEDRATAAEVDHSIDALIEQSRRRANKIDIQGILTGEDAYKKMLDLAQQKLAYIEARARSLPREQLCDFTPETLHETFVRIFGERVAAAVLLSQRWKAIRDLCESKRDELGRANGLRDKQVFEQKMKDAASRYLSAASDPAIERSIAAPIMEQLVTVISVIDSHFGFVPDILSAYGLPLTSRSPSRASNYTCTTRECVAFGPKRTNPFLVHLQILQDNTVELYAADYNDGPQELATWSNEQVYESDKQGRVSGGEQWALVCAALANLSFRNGALALRDPTLMGDQIIARLNQAIGRAERQAFGGAIAEIPEFNMRLDVGVSRPGLSCIVNIGR